MSESERLGRVADLTDAGQQCHDEGDHECAIESLATAYQMLGHDERVGRLGSNSIDLVIGSYAALAMGSDRTLYRSSFEIAKDTIDLQISEIDNHCGPETRKEEGKIRERRKARRACEAEQQRLSEHRLDLQASSDRLAILLISLDEEIKTTVSPPPDTGEPDPDDDDDDGPIPETGPKPPEGPKWPWQKILGTVGIVGGSLATFSGAALMVNGAAWTQCAPRYRDADGNPSRSCSWLVGVRSALSPATDADGMADPEDVVSSDKDTTRRKSVQSWVLGSIITAAGIASVTWGAVAVKRARDRRHNTTLAFTWSPQSPREGALSISGRF